MKSSVLATILVILLIIMVILSGGIGALKVAPADVFAIILSRLGLDIKETFTPQQEAVIMAIRLPRIFFGVIIGATLSVCGAAMQGLFRNPLADPGLVGVSSGASLSAVLAIVLGAGLFASLPASMGLYALSFCTFLGAFITTIIVYRISQAEGKTIVSTMLLAGIAIGALAGAITGFITLSATDEQLRTITFWNLGSLGGANWKNFSAILPFTFICIMGLPMLSKSLNAFTLGESSAAHLGINVERLKMTVIILTALGVGACVSVSGNIGFVGLVVPHIVRKITGPEHKALFINSALLGALLLVAADLACRTIIAPVELPIGIATALIGAPFFLYLLLKERKKNLLF